MNLPPSMLREARRSQGKFLLAVCFGLLAGIMGIFQAQNLSRLISNVFLQGGTLSSVSGMIITLGVIVISRAGLAWLSETWANAAARQIKQSLFERIFTCLLGAGPASLRSNDGQPGTQTGELVNTSTQGLDAIEKFYSQYLPQVPLAEVIPVTILVFVFPSDLVSGLVLLLTAPLMPLFMVLISRMAESVTRKQWQGLSRMSAYFLDVLQGLTTLKALNRSRDQSKVIEAVSEHYRQSTMDVLKVTFLSALVLELITTLSTALVAVEVGLRLLYGKMAFEQAFFVLLLAPEFYQSLRLLGTRFHAGVAGVEAAKRIFPLLDSPLLLPTEAGPDLGQATSLKKPFPSIRFDHINYSYASRQALHDISLEIPAGKMTAIYGESGAVKTTLTWLLLRFLQPQSGDITVGSRQLSSIPVREWWGSLAWVPQGPYLFNDTITANIRLANPSASDEAIRDAARQAHADEFILQMPGGYDTIIGEHGARLSAGQAQRLALARAFLKDAPLLILDEATSHLDPETDALIQESLARLSSNRTVLVVAHRRSTLAWAHQVVKLSHGRLEQCTLNQVPGVKLTDPLSIHELTGSAQAPARSGDDYHQAGGENQPGSSQKPVLLRLASLLAPYTGRILLSIFLGTATIASGVGLMATAAYVISAAALHPSIADLQVAIVGVRFFGLSRGVFRYLERLVSHDVTFRLLARWRVWFYQALEPLAPARLLQYHSGDLLSRILHDISILEGFYVRTLTPPLVALVIITGAALFMDTILPGLAWVLAGFLLLAGLALPSWTWHLSHRLGPQLVEARASLSTLLVDGIQGLPELCALNQVDTYINRLNHAGQQEIRLQSRMASLAALQTSLGSLVSNLCMLSLLALAIPWAADGTLPGVLLGVIVLAALTSFESVQALPTAAQHLETQQAAARRLYELVDTTPLIQDPVQPRTLPVDNHLELKGVGFIYPPPIESSPSALPGFSLQDISLSLPPGRHIALVGPSGSGKTSLANLLLRFWDYQRGSILWGGTELRSCRQAEVRQRLGVISQDTYLFSATIRENLLIARPDASETQVVQALQAAQLYPLIQSLPDGLDTWIGEHGTRLSSGERQRLALARLFLKDASLLLLDEPTGSLDPATAAEVLSSIQLHSRGVFTVTITQDLRGLETMDEIFVMRSGRIIEHGSPQELLSRRGYYYRMHELYHQVI